MAWNAPMGFKRLHRNPKKNAKCIPIASENNQTIPRRWDSFLNLGILIPTPPCETRGIPIMNDRVFCHNTHAPVFWVWAHQRCLGSGLCCASRDFGGEVFRRRSFSFRSQFRISAGTSASRKSPAGNHGMGKNGKQEKKNSQVANREIGNTVIGARNFRPIIEARTVSPPEHQNIPTHNGKMIQPRYPQQKRRLVRPKFKRQGEYNTTRLIYERNV